MIKTLPDEVTREITNARHAEQDGTITKEQADAVIQHLLENIALQLDLHTFQTTTA